MYFRTVGRVVVMRAGEATRVPGRESSQSGGAHGMRLADSLGAAAARSDCAPRVNTRLAYVLQV